jgi:probable rRNA maturation factor
MSAANKRSAHATAAAEPPPSCVRVEVTNETDADVDSARIAAAVQIVLADADCTVANISIAIVDDPTIHRLNRQFLEHDYPTDVLSFVLEEPPRLAGEIIASIDTARREAADVGWDAADELLLYAVHGALHLVGHRDKQPAESAAMRSAERRVLEQLGVRVAPADPRWREINATGPRGQEANAP